MIDVFKALQDMGQSFVLNEGEVLCEAGDKPDMLWLLVQGVLGVRLADTQRGDDELCAHDNTAVLVGEVGLFTHEQRTAKVWAKRDCLLYRIPVQAIEARCDADFQAAMHRLMVEYWLYPVLSQQHLFRGMNDIDRRVLCDLFQVRTVPESAVLMACVDDHDGAYLVQQGRLRVSCQSEHGDDAQCLLKPGDMVHMGGLLHGCRAPCRAVAASDVRLLHLSRADFETIAKKRPWMIQTLLRHVRRPAVSQILHPDEAYLWMTNREIQARRVGRGGVES